LNFKKPIYFLKGFLFETKNMKKPILIALIIVFIASCSKESITNTPTQTTQSHRIGELFGGGIIFNIYKDKTGIEHGLISSLADISMSTYWSAPGAGGGTETKAISSWNGQLNTQNIISILGFSATAANLCKSYTGGNFTDWYFPSILELQTLRDQQAILNDVLENDQDITSTVFSPELYWTSVEVDGGGGAYTVDFRTGTVGYQNKQAVLCKLRAIRKF